ncbi:MAG: deacetylase [Desulfomonilaceae bacterium]
MPQQIKFFLITVDTEGDNLWSRPRRITTRNARFIPRFQELCEKFGLKPCYLTNYEMAADTFFQEFGGEVLKRRTAEIGMHLHAWNSPPELPLGEDDYRNQPYLIEYSEPVIWQKIDYLTSMLEDLFQTKITNHRAGRWALNEVYAKLLLKRGYRVDCSVTPHVSWEAHLGDPNGTGGSDYTDFPDHPYLLNNEDIRLSGSAGLLELPVTIYPGNQNLLHRLIKHLNPANPVKRVANLVFPSCYILAPRRFRLSELHRIVEWCIAESRTYVHFMTHSSELMPGGGPAFRTAADIDRLYANLERLFAKVCRFFKSVTLSEYYDYFLDCNESEDKLKFKYRAHNDN